MFKYLPSRHPVCNTRRPLHLSLLRFYIPVWDPLYHAVVMQCDACYELRITTSQARGFQYHSATPPKDPGGSRLELVEVVSGMSRRYSRNCTREPPDQLIRDKYTVHIQRFVLANGNSHSSSCVLIWWSVPHPEQLDAQAGSFIIYFTSHTMIDLPLESGFSWSNTLYAL